MVSGGIQITKNSPRIRVDPLFEKELRRFHDELLKARIMEDRNLRLASKKLGEIMQEVQFNFAPGEINLRGRRRKGQLF